MGLRADGRARGTLVLLGVSIAVVVVAWWMLPGAGEAPADPVQPASTEQVDEPRMELEPALEQDAQPLLGQARPVTGSPEAAAPGRAVRSGQAPRLVRVLDESGQPLPGALVWPVPAAGGADAQPDVPPPALLRASEQSTRPKSRPRLWIGPGDPVPGLGQAGETGEFHWPADSLPVPRLHVAAPGYALTGVERDGDVFALHAACEPDGDDGASWEGELLVHPRGRDAWPDVLEVQLRRVPTVAVTVTCTDLPEEFPGCPVSLQLRSATEVLPVSWPFEVARKLRVIPLAPIPGTWATWSDGRPEALYRGFGGLADGPLLVSGLRPSEPFELAVLGATGAPGGTASVVLAEGEWRDVELHLDLGGAVVGGVVLDPEGDPVKGAEVQWAVADNAGPEAGMVITDADGRFRWEHAGSHPIDLRVVAGGFAEWLASDVDPAEASALSISLSREARWHRVRFIERGTGRLIPMEHVRVVHNELWSRSVGDERNAAGEALVCWPVGARGDVLGYVIGGGMVRAPLAPGDLTEVEVPQGGSLDVSWPQDLVADLERWLELSWQGAEQPLGNWRLRNDREADRWTYDHLMPQLYTVELQVREPAPPGDGDRAERPRPGPWRPVARAEVLIDAGGRHTLRLEPLP